MSVKRLTRAAVLTAIALTIFIVELQIPSIVPIPGVKLGLANIITVYAMFVLGPADTFAILIVRILLGSMFSGQMMSLAYSLCGGCACYLVMLVMRRIVTQRQIWVCSAVGAMAHNIGQIAVAILITQTPSLIIYLPVLLISGVVTGIFTGICAQFVVNRLVKAGTVLDDRRKGNRKLKSEETTAVTSGSIPDNVNFETVVENNSAGENDNK